jgi:Zn-dependent membrane protease YugP
MKRDQINPQPILWVLGFFITVCSIAIVGTILQAIAALFAV